MGKSQSTSSSISIVALLGLAFIILKLCKVIAWSWWWVTAPFWIPAGIAVVCLVIWLVVMIIAAISK